MEIETIQSAIEDILANIDIWASLKFALLLSIGCFAAGLILRIFFGKRSNLRKAADAAIAILIIYGIHFFFLLSEGPIRQYLPPLPFVSISGETLSFFVLKGAIFHDICTELVNMLILAFLVGLICDWMPTGKNLFSWFLFRCLGIVCSMAAHWAVSLLLFRYFPGFVSLHAPTVLMVIVGILLAVSLFRLIIGTLLGLTVSPLVGAIYTFLISSVVGKQITRASLATALLTLAVYLLNHFGIAAVSLTETLLPLFLPAGIVLFIIWYLIQKWL